ncbi:MAG: carbohydrate ABC transporter permease [Candidatus Tectomicrobia bacterium]|uniref:Carbohydrate ABC transporter permease n=1 Tax=Tectimicrobiota bacterium TaxID=2528274 RepID=A0A932I2C1_UNCTE|nr:carbohydrate ABC transporter permease [Candidatus Tectomicrobia bacterium]
MKRTMKRRLFAAGRFFLLGIALFVVGFPMYWMLITSFKPDHEWFTWPPVYWSENWTLDNYRVVWAGIGIKPTAQEATTMQKPVQALKHSLALSLISTTLSVAFGTLVAYGVSRYQILSDRRMFNLLMLRMVPPIVVAAPLTLYYSTLQLLDTLTGLVIVYVLTTLPYSIWMTKSFLDEIPREMEQAASILGAGRWRTIWEVIFPLIRSGVVATFLFILILTWSEYLLALILSKVDVVTLPVQLSKYEGTTEGRVYGYQAALAVGVTLPLIVIGCFIRKHLVRGFSFGMIKR